MKYRGGKNRNFLDIYIVRFGINRATGLVTSVRTRVLGVTPVKWLTVTTYYDDRCRVIQTVSDNLEGGLSRVDMKYDFTGNVVRQRESHVVGGRTDVLETENTYDDRGRLLSSTVKLNNGSPATTSYTYDAVGRLVKKKHGRVEETMAYNTRGWLTSKESVPFKMKLRYENPSGGSVARWNGNISEWEWQHGTGAALMYGFVYDGVNRLTGTVQKQKSGMTWSALTGSYLEKGITYDRNGNIKTLQRTANGTTVDNLVYSYTGNQLTGLTENVRTSPTGDVYSPRSAAAGSYSYDSNGNMTNDSRRALNLSYNVLNLLSEVKTGSTVKASYGYLADGTKLRVRDAGSNGFDYVGSLTYKSGGGGLQLESASFGDGVILTGTGGQEVNYFLTDHLGSVRVIVDGSGVVKERNDYYPFGARHVKADYPRQAVNRFKYNGKEEQVTGGLEYLDYGARMYDSGLGRWFVNDPLQENYLPQSPYHFSGNNPIILRDKDGQLYDWYFNEKNELTYDASIHSQKDLDRKKIKGKYVGQTYIQGNVYYGLFGDIMDLATWEGKLFKKIDELFINYFKYRQAIDKFDTWMQDEPIEKSVNFDIGLKFKRDNFGLADGNMYPFKFQGSNAFYFVSEDRTKMNGIFELGDNKRKLNATISSTSIGAGYNMYINTKGSSRSKIIIFVFPTLESKNKFHKKMRAEYEKYQ
ncbi:MULTISPECIES: RHS repeat domain-containing protein [Butyricimonas]|uniref:RHS repeat domain-containing protein n=1 Tax=Butyricimonas TaxID=574697 RepID=UPI0007FB245F|nr:MULTISPECIES: RHS repeat-associated core domain-containing protein [Butyricimonas]